MNWRRAYVESFLAVRDQLRRERSQGQAPRRARGVVGVDMRDSSDAEIDRYARREAERRTQEALNREIERRRRDGGSVEGFVEEVGRAAA